MCRKMMWVFGLRRLTSSAIKGHGVRRIPRSNRGAVAVSGTEPEEWPIGTNFFFKVLAHAWWSISLFCVQKTQFSRSESTLDQVCILPVKKKRIC